MGRAEQCTRTGGARAADHSCASTAAAARCRRASVRGLAHAASKSGEL